MFSFILCQKIARKTIKQMLSKIFRPTKISSSTTIISLATLFSYVFGLIRDRIVSTTFGATVETDAFNAAFLLPDMLVNIFITSALSAAFLPVFTDYLKKNDSKADKLATQILTIFTFFIGICSILIALNLKWIVPSLYKDFPLEGQLLITELTKMALVSGLIFAISNTIGNILMSKKHFLSYALSPIFSQYRHHLRCSIFRVKHWNILSCSWCHYWCHISFSNQIN